MTHISRGRTRQSNRFNLKTPLCRTSTFKASYFNHVTKLWNFVYSLSPPSSFSSMQSFKQFVHKTVLTSRVNTYEVETSCMWTLVMTCPCHRSKRLYVPHPLFCPFLFTFVVTAVITNTHPQRVFFLFKPGFCWTTINHYHGFSRVGLGNI